MRRERALRVHVGLYVITIMMSGAFCRDRLPGNWPVVIISGGRIHPSPIQRSFPASLSLLLTHLLLFPAAGPAPYSSDRCERRRYLRVCSARARKLLDFRRFTAICATASLATDFAGWASLQLQQLSRSTVTSALDVVRVVSNVRWSWLRVTLQCMRRYWRRHFRRLFSAILSFTLTDCG